MSVTARAKGLTTGAVGLAAVGALTFGIGLQTSPADAVATPSVESLYSTLTTGTPGGLIELAPTDDPGAVAAKAARGPVFSDRGPDGPDVGNARHARVKGGGDVWLTTGHGGICALGRTKQQPSPAAICAPADRAQDGVVMTMGGLPKGGPEFAPGQTVVFGAMPNGVSDVLVVDVTGAERVVPVTDNAFYLDSAVPVRTASWTGANGARTITLGGPDAP